MIEWKKTTLLDEEHFLTDITVIMSYNIEQL